MAAPQVEQYVNHVQILTNSEKFQELGEIITKSIEPLAKNLQYLEASLESLELPKHSLGILAVLVAKFNLSNSNNSDAFTALFIQFKDFINKCSIVQVRYAPELFAELCHIFTQKIVELKIPIQGIDILCKAIKKYQKINSQLTSIHADLYKLCLLSKCFKPSIEFLNIDVTSISNECGQQDSKYFLLYYYYGGMIYTALKNYERALYFFEVCITLPAMAVSHIMLEAYKKYILISLMIHGKINDIPKYASPVLIRFIKPLSQVYQELAIAYQSHNCQDVQCVINKYQDVFIRDHNRGLVGQVYSYLYKKNIQSLTKTFLTLSVTDVGSRVQLSGPAEAEKYVLNMIEDGEIFATINHKDGMVVFHDDPEKYNSPRMLARLEKEMATCAELDKKVLEQEEEVMQMPLFIRKTCGPIDQDDNSSSNNVNHIMSKHNPYSM